MASLATQLEGWKFISGFLPFLFARDELAMTIFYFYLPFSRVYLKGEEPPNSYG